MPARAFRTPRRARALVSGRFRHAVAPFPSSATRPRARRRAARAQMRLLGRRLPARRARRCSRPARRTIGARESSPAPCAYKETPLPRPNTRMTMDLVLTWIVCTALVVALFAILSYFGRPYWGWVAAMVLALLFWRAGGVFSGIVFWMVAGFAAVLALVFGLRGVRAALVTGQAFPTIRAGLPKMSETERAALEAGTVGWDGELFGGAPDWRKLIEFPVRDLDARERAFLAGEVNELCRMLDDHKVAREGDLPTEAWDFIKRAGLMGMIIPRSYGGLEFSARMQSAVVARLSSRSVTAAVSVMVPNSLGPAELLLHYGTDEQKRHYLPRLASGEEVPCFALTEPAAGSDAAAMRSTGVVCRGAWNGKEVLGMRLDWNKRYITLSPIATVLGLAFKLRDPDRLLGTEEDIGITCALIPTDMPGIEIGERHDPMGVPFLNGPTRGRDVFVPLDFVIGGPKMAGHGWVMLMQCLAAGRGISLPALSAGASQLATRRHRAHAHNRQQVGLPVGKASW